MDGNIQSWARLAGRQMLGLTSETKQDLVLPRLTQVHVSTRQC
jgi:hypothetical protein